jgi:hypothetical protein
MTSEMTERFLDSVNLGDHLSTLKKYFYVQPKRYESLGVLVLGACYEHLNRATSKFQTISESFTDTANLNFVANLV